ncbi:MAG: hypothetical protein N2316_05440 [Spirochaetes bacterium]|nr:hypothetical protein [Spirochaetota bacterium]
MGLSDDEIRLLIEKLRVKYTEYAKKYSPKWFNLMAFEERLNFAIKKGMNLEGFILAEITNFEKIKEKYEKKKSAKTFSEKVDQIIEEQLSRIKKYPKIEFHPRADIEMMHFYGAGCDFALYDYPIVTYCIRNEPQKSESFEFENKLGYLFVASGKRLSKRIEDHVRILSRKGVSETEIEKDKNEFLKEGAFLFHEIINFITHLIEVRNREWELPITFEKLFFEKDRKNTIITRYNAYTAYGAFLKVKTIAESIIADFRLGAFKKN